LGTCPQYLHTKS